MSTASRQAGWLAAAIFAMAAPGVAQQYRFRSYGTEDGLTNMAVKVLFQDHLGFLWAATESGVFRYGGQRFQRFGSDQGLPNEVIVSLGEAPDGALLAGCRAGLFQLKGDRFEKVELFEAGVVDSYSSIQSDGHSRTYIATNQGLTIASRSREAERWAISLQSTPAAAGGSDAHGVYLEGTKVWFGCGAGLCRMDPDGTAFFGSADGLPAGHWTCIRRDGAGDLWVKEKNHIAVMRRGSTRFDTAIPSFPNTAGGGQLAVDAAGRLLVPSVEGLAINDGGHFKIIGKREGLRSPVYSVLQDREGSVWLGLAGKGLARWQGYGKWDGFAADSGLDAELIYQILQAGDGSLWAGTETGLFHGRKTSELWGWQRYESMGQIPVRTVHMDRAGKMWLGTENYGVIRIDLRTGQKETFGKMQGIEGTVVTSLLPDNENRVWVGTDRGLFVRPSSGGDFRRVEEIGKSDCLAVIEGPDGEILAGTANGLFRQTESGWQRIGKADGLLDDRILALTAAKSGEIWVGYWFSGSISRITLVGKHVTVVHYGREHGLLGEMTYFLGFDTRGWLWAGTDQGVGVWNGSGWRQYDQNDGLIWNDCDVGAFLAQADGTVWIGTSGGLARFRPGSGRQPAPPAPAIFTKLALGGVSVPPDQFISVSHQASSLSVHYAAPTFLRELTVRFRYRIEPLLSDWRETSQRELQFPRLPSGDYKLEVEASDGLGHWVAPAAAFDFEIRPPWWDAWWFRLLAGAAALLLLRIGWWARVSQWVRRQKELEHAVAERTAQLQQEAQQLLLAREALRERSVTDGLTTLYNRNALFERLEKELIRAGRENNSLAVILADLDFFKKVNDEHGHLVGDAVLREAARRIVESVRPYDSVGRYGGEEFAIVMPGCGSEEAWARAERIRQAMARQPFATSGGPIPVTCSFGVAITKGGAQTPEEIVELADQALYLAKERGRNCVAVPLETATCVNWGEPEIQDGRDREIEVRR